LINMSNQDSKRPALEGHEEIIITPDTGSATGKPDEDGPISTIDPRATPAQPDSDPEDEKPLHLDFPAPTFERVGESVSTWGMRLPGFSAEWQTRGETQCIRCKVLAVSRTFAVSIRGVVGIGATAEYTGFYPHVHADLEVAGQSILGHQDGHITRRPNGGPEAAPEGGGRVLLSGEMDLAPLGFRYEKSVTRPGEVVLVPSQIPPYMVLGIFSGADGIPRERMVTVKQPSLLFWYLFWAILRLRGITWLFSLKDVKGFAVYKVSLSVSGLLTGKA
jgi:hypothetical protein